MKFKGGLLICAANKLRDAAKRFADCRRGSSAMMFAVTLPALLGGAGIATDMAMFSMKRTELQATADQAAIATAKELALSRPSDASLQATAQTYVNAQLNGRSVAAGIQVDSNNAAVTVELTEIWTPFFAHYIGADITPVKVHAKASLQGESKICVLALLDMGMGGLSMIESAKMQADGCSVYSNSTSSNGVYLGDSAMITADTVCSAGGVFSTGSTSQNIIQTDCPKIPDPLAARPVPKFGMCDYTKKTVSSGKLVLQPGVYCGGLTISNAAQVSFAPGDYIIKDGLFIIKDNAVVTGNDVGFYLTGALALLSFSGNASIDFNGREKGAMAGLLFFEDPKSSLFRIHYISAANAHNLTGTIYLPKGNLMVDPNSSVGEKSAYTAIIARRLIVENGPTLVLNSNYSATSVPVPAGIRSTSQVVLVD